MALENLPGIFPLLEDGNLVLAEPNENPVVLVIGTSPKGDTEKLYRVDSVSNAARDFGRDDGTLVRGIYEAVAGGAANIRAMRIGATAAVLANVGTGITITTVEKDDNAGDNYKLFWDDTAKRLRIWRVSDDLLVYDNNPTYPSAAVDLNELSVSGTSSGTPGDIGTLGTPVTLTDADGVSGASFTAGSDGITLSRMELFESLFKAYKLLENEDLDIIVPMNVYLDDLNVRDMTTAQVTTLNTSAPWASSSVYPEPGSSFDALGQVFAQEYQGEWYFWWDMDRDGVAEIYPSVGSATASLDTSGTAITASDYHEANFGYQLADFCYRQSEDNAEMVGVIGMLPPVSWSLKDVSNWVGKEPVAADDGNGNSIITTNGSGLLGNKWMAGRVAVGGTGLPGHAIGNLDGVEGGGFIGTDDGWPDGGQERDRNNHLIDIGKYLSVVGSIGVMANPSSATSYAATGAAVYAGFISTLPANSAPTNKVIPGIRLPFRVSVSKHDLLAGHRYVMFQLKSKGLVVADAPTAARLDSDYRRYSTFAIVKATIDAIRSVSEPFLGEAITGARLAALETAINQALTRLQKGGFLQRFKASVQTTPSQLVLGKVNVELVLVPAFELRQITVNVALAAQ